jgi:hypothetical protein
MPHLLPVVAVCGAVCLAAVGHAFAQDVTASPPFDLEVIRQALVVESPPSLEAEQIDAPTIMPTTGPVKPTGTSRVMWSLYGATVATQVLDTHSTLLALDAGAREGNPALSALARNRAAFLVTKAAATAGTIYLAKRLERTHRRLAIISLVAINSAYACIVIHNYRVRAAMR